MSRLSGGEATKKGHTEEEYMESKRGIGTNPLGYLWSNQSTSNSGMRYILCFIDDYSRKGWVYLLKNKSDAFTEFKTFKKMVETETGKVIKGLRTDRGGEYTSLEFSDYCKEHGIRRQLTTSYTPQQNGIAERKNRTVMNMVRSMFSNKKMPKILWPKAVKWTFYVLNRCPTIAVKNVTPQEAWSGMKPSVEHFRVWGCIVHVHIPDQKRSKLDDKSTPCVLLGYSEESKAYRLYNPKTKKMMTSRDVVFEETKEWDWNEDQDHLTEGSLTWNGDDVDWEESDEEDNNGEVEDNNNETEHPVEDAVENQEEQTAEIREGRARRPPSYLRDYVHCIETIDNEEEVVNMVEINATDPVNFEEAEKNLKWRDAMTEEINSIEKNQTWELCTLPNGAKCIGVKWIYKTKLNELGEIIKHKARLVAKGYSQELGIDYTEVYAPVARMDTIRTILATAAQKSWIVYQLDVKSAFLHSLKMSSYNNLKGT